MGSEMCIRDSIKGICALARKSNLEVARFRSGEIRDAVNLPSRARRYAIAVAVTQWFPELLLSLPKER